MRTYWWVHPVLVTVVLMLPIVLLAAGLGDGYYQNFGHERSYVDGQVLFVALTAMLMFCAGAGLTIMLLPLSRGTVPDGQFMVDKTHYKIGLTVMAMITLAGNLAIVAPVLAQPDLIVGVLFEGDISAFVLKREILRVPGMTSVSNFGPLVAVLIGSKLWLVGERINRFEMTILVLVVTSILLRSLIASERLAVIEFALPLMVAAFGRYDGRWNPVLSLGPVLGGVAVIVFFGLTEYFRSWVYYQHYYTDFWGFMLERITGYYTTALNNGAGLFVNFPPHGEPVMTLKWFYQFPLFPWAGRQDTVVYDFLWSFANLEFNNTSGVFAPIVDLGATAGIAVWFALGMLTGALYQGFRKGEFIATLLYPTWCIGVYEILRTFYWGDTRFFPIILATAAFLSLVARRRSRRYLPVTTARAHPLAPVGSRVDGRR